MDMTVTAREAEQVRLANESGALPIVFVHGLWLLAGSWTPWVDFFTERGYAPVAVEWPGEQATIDEARANPDALAGLSVTEIADHGADVVAGLARRPVLIGHSFGGLIVQMLAGRGLATATVAIDPAPSQGVLPLPFSTIKATLPVLANPLNARRAVSLTFEQFRYGFANAVPEEEGRSLFEHHHTPAPGRPLFQAATANLNPRARTKVDRKNPDRGPMLLVSGEEDNIVPPAVVNAAHKRQARNRTAPTELLQIAGAGHSLVIDSHWAHVAAAVHDFLARQEAPA